MFSRAARSVPSRTAKHRLIQGDCFQRAGVGDRVGGGRNVSPRWRGSMRHAGGGGQALGMATHQFRVVDRQQRRDIAVDDGHFTWRSRR